MQPTMQAIAIILLLDVLPTNCQDAIPSHISKSIRSRCGPCPPGSQPDCKNKRPGESQASSGCSKCQLGEFSPGSFEACRECSTCPPGQGATNWCPLWNTNDTKCRPCTNGKTYSDSNDTNSCNQCSECTTTVLKSCTIYHDIQCSNICPRGKYWHRDSETCMETGHSTKVHVNVIIAAAVVTPVVVILIFVAVIFLYKLRRSRQPRSLPQSELGKILTYASLVKELPMTLKKKLSMAFMEHGSKVYYKTFELEFGFSDSEMSELFLYCQQSQIIQFATKFFEVVERQELATTLSDLCSLLAKRRRPDLITKLKDWGKEEGLDVQINEEDFTEEDDPSLPRANSTSSNEDDLLLPGSPPSQRST